MFLFKILNKTVTNLSEVPAKLLVLIPPIIGGFSLGLFLWEISNIPLLRKYIESNTISIDARMSITQLTLICLVIFSVLHIAIGWVHKNRNLKEHPNPRTLQHFLISPILLPLLPVLYIPTTTTFLSCFVILIECSLFYYFIFHLKDAFRFKNKTPSLNTNVYIPFLLALIAFYNIFLNYYTFHKFDTFDRTTWDLAMYNNICYNIIHCGKTISYLVGNPGNNFGLHFSPIYYLIAPIYAIYENPKNLLAIQTFSLSMGALPVFLLTKLKLKSNVIGICFSIAYLLFPALHGANTFDFHGITIAVPIILFALYFLEKGKHYAFLGCLVFAFLIKEDVPLTGIGIGAYLLFSNEKKNLGLLVLSLSLLFFISSMLIIDSFDETLSIHLLRWGRYSGVISNKMMNPTGILATIVTNPLFLVKYLFFDTNKLLYILQIFGPLMLVPLFCRLRLWLMIIPALSLILLASHKAHFSLNYHYSATIIPIVFFMLIKSTASFSHKYTTAFTICLSSILFSFQFGHLPMSKKHNTVQLTQNMVSGNEIINSIPINKKVSTVNSATAHLSSRPFVKKFPDIEGAEYIFFEFLSHQTTYNPYKYRHEAVAEFNKLLESGDWGIREIKNGYALAELGHETTLNDHFLKQLNNPIYEAEYQVSSFSINPNNVQEDSAASNNLALYANAESLSSSIRGSIMLKIKSAHLSEGNYILTCRLKTNNNSSSKNIASIQIVNQYNNTVIAQRKIQAIEFDDTMKYFDFSLNFNVEDQSSLEYRLFYGGYSDLWADSVCISEEAEIKL